jgi:hypothetical protein
MLGAFTANPGRPSIEFKSKSAAKWALAKSIVFVFPYIEKDRKTEIV